MKIVNYMVSNTKMKPITISANMQIPTTFKNWQEELAHVRTVAHELYPNYHLVGFCPCMAPDEERKSCCDNEERTMSGGCKNCGDPSY